jgi:hypothetical protein
MTAKTICRFVIVHGPLIVVSVYLTWFVGRLSLGYWPRPSLDDPKDIAWVGPFRIFALSLSLFWPVVVGAGVVAATRAWIAKHPERKVRLLEVLLGIVVLACCMLFMRVDPLHVGSWFMD